MYMVGTSNQSDPENPNKTHGWSLPSPCAKHLGMFLCLDKRSELCLSCIGVGWVLGKEYLFVLKLSCKEHIIGDDHVIHELEQFTIHYMFLV